MVESEWALIIFTLLTQTAVGVFVISLVINQLMNKRLGQEEIFSLIIPTQYVAAILAVASMAASLFHLGSPLSAPAAILNLGSSWLSREILLTGLFALLCLVIVWMAKKQGKIPVGLACVNAVVGLVGIFAMSKVYSTVLIPAWQSTYTFVAFFGTCFMLGTLVALGTVVFAMNKNNSKYTAEMFKTILLPVSLIAFVAVFVQTTTVPNYMASLSANSEAGQSTAQILANNFGFMLGLRWVLVALSFLILVIAIWKQLQTQGTCSASHAGAEAAVVSPGSIAVSGNLIYIAMAAMIAGELIGRYLFYATGVQIMIG